MRFHSIHMGSAGLFAMNDFKMNSGAEEADSDATGRSGTRLRADFEGAARFVVLAHVSPPTCQDFKLVDGQERVV
jgi:hypothetical protein